MRYLVLSLFFFSGACGLVYQVVWVRMMTHVFGTTATAVGVVLAAFMAGLALGSWRVGRSADQHPNPLRYYAGLEIGIGVAALGTHAALGAMTPLYLTLYEFSGHSETTLAVSRFVLAFGLVMLPTFLMGATLPVATRLVVRRVAEAGSGLSALYAVNTLGGVVGVLLCGFYLIGTLGVHESVYVAALCNITIGVIAWRVSRGAVVAPAVTPAAAKEATLGVPLPDQTYRWLLVALGISGLTSFAYEIYWTRSLVFLLGNSTYALSTMLTAFIVGIALGGGLVGLVVDRVQDRVTLFAWIQVALAVASAAALPFLFAFVEPGAIRSTLGGAAGDGDSLILARFGVAFVVMLLPASLIGATFPLVGRAGIMDLDHTSRRVGVAYASNTLGNVAGALLPGFVLLNWLGVQRGILLMASLNALVGFGLLGWRAWGQHGLRWPLPIAALGVSIVFVWVPLDFQFPTENERATDEVLFYRDGPSATTKVTFDPNTGTRLMAIDGIVIGGNTFTEYKQVLLAHLPKLLVDDVSRELSIGFGTGMLAGESLRHAGVERVTSVEIEPSVVEGAAYFGRENHHVLSNARSRVVIDDVANHLRTTSSLYQVISADEKTALEYASNGFSYSLEYYALLRQRLAPGGILIQWVPANLPPNLYLMVLKTFSDGFPHVLMAHFMPALDGTAYNTILIGSNDPVVLDRRRMGRVMRAEPEALRSLMHYGLTTPEAVIAQFVAGGSAIRAAVEGVEVNSLAHPRYEFYSPRDYAVSPDQRVATNIEFIATLMRTAAPSLWLASGGMGREETARLERLLAAEQAYLQGYRVSLAAGPVSGADIIRNYDTALSLAPENQSLRARIAFHYTMIARSQSNPRVKIQLIERALAIHDGTAMTHVEYSRALSAIGQPERALEAAQTAVEMAPELPVARRRLADLLMEAGLRGE